MLSKVTTLLVTTIALVVLGAATAFAGTYYVNSCSTFGNTAPAFASWTDSDHMNAANECMQPASDGGYRSLELNNSPGAAIYQGNTAHWITNSPSPSISIVGAYTPYDTVFADCNLNSDGFAAQFFWGGGSQTIYRTGTCNKSQGYGFGTGVNSSFAPSSYFGWSATCSTKSTCSTSSSAGAVLGVEGVQLTAQETSGPGLIADSANNLWYQSGHWVRGGGWPVGFTATDASGVCTTGFAVNGQLTGIDGSDDTSPNTASFTQCWPTDSVQGTLDTSSYPNGQLTIQLESTNAANVSDDPVQTLQVDNTPVTLSLSTPNDSDPNVWVNHSVEVRANASAGPSRLGGTACTTNNGSSYTYPAQGITVNGSGVWRVSCVSWNNALDANGQIAYSPEQTEAIHIDETPPSISFAPVNPADPQQVVVNTTDGQSGVAGGAIQMRPVLGGNWQSLATQFDGAHLLGQFDDAALTPGDWEIEATSCDHAGNCASADETLSLPLRTASVSSVGFEQRKDPRGAAADCTHRARRHRQQVARDCRGGELVFVGEGRSRFGASSHLQGQLTTAQGRPIANATIRIMAAPDDGLSQYSQVATATTGSEGTWRAVLPAGPSRLIAAIYDGSPTIQPSQGSATLTVPASIKVLRVWPRHARWGGKVHIEAQLMGRYFPSEGALVRLRLGYGHAKITYGVKEHVHGNGVFEVTNRFGPGPASLVLHYWLQECTLPQGDYPFGPACGPRSAVTVGGLAG